MFFPYKPTSSSWSWSSTTCSSSPRMQVAAPRFERSLPAVQVEPSPLRRPRLHPRVDHVRPQTCLGRGGSTSYISTLIQNPQVSVKAIGDQLHWFRFFQFVRMFRIDRRAETWAMLGRWRRFSFQRLFIGKSNDYDKICRNNFYKQIFARVVGAHWHELASTGYIGLILLLITSFTGVHTQMTMTIFMMVMMLNCMMVMMNTHLMMVMMNKHL